MAGNKSKAARRTLADEAEERGVSVDDVAAERYGPQGVGGPALGGNGNGRHELAGAEEGMVSIVGPDGRVGGVVSAREMISALEGEGERLRHVGGALPTLDNKTAFRRVGDSILVKFLGVTEATPEEGGRARDFNLATFEVLDFARYRATRDADASSLYTAQMINGASLQGWTARAENVGKVVVVTYMGEQERRTGNGSMKLYAISEVAKGRKA